MSVLELFCDVDDFCRHFEPKWHKQCLASRSRHRNRARELALSEIMTILILFHQSHYRTFKAFYTEHVCVDLRGEFPGLVSYTRFVEFFPSALIPLCVYLHSCLGACSGISFVDSTKVAVCHNRRIQQHRVFRGLAARGKTSVDWFFGFKLHLVFNDRGELVTFTLTPGNVDDRKPVPQFAKRLFGKLVGDKGYLSNPLLKQLHSEFGIELITARRKNMKARELDLLDKLLLRKRAIVETIIDQLKNISQIEHTRHRSPINFLVNLVCGLIAYCHQPKKPSLQLNALPPAMLA
jgi:Transposase DDE domain